MLGSLSGTLSCVGDAFGENLYVLLFSKCSVCTSNLLLFVPYILRIYHGNWQETRVWQGAFQIVCLSLPTFHHGWWHTQSVRCLYGSGARSVSSRGSWLSSSSSFVYANTPLLESALWGGRSLQCSSRFRSRSRWGRAAPEIVGITNGSDRKMEDGQVLFSFFPCQIYCSIAGFGSTFWNGFFRPASEHGARFIFLWGGRKCERRARWGCGFATTVSFVRGAVGGVTRAVAKLNIEWPTDKERQERPKSKLDELFLRSRSPSPRRGSPFSPDLHNELSRSWDKPYSSRLFDPIVLNYSSVLGLNEHGYGKITSFSSIFLVDLKLGLIGGVSPNSVLAPHIEKSKNGALPLVPLLKVRRVGGAPGRSQEKWRIWGPSSSIKVLRPNGPDSSG